MELQHRFTVPAGIDATWAHFDDIAEVAGCFPGAVVTEADEQSFTGTVKVKLGPIALVYNGTGTFVEKDAAAHRMVIDAKGKDKRGNGTAGALVTATMTSAGPDATDVEVVTDLSITGKAAQFGRGNVMKDVSDKLLGQFVACLEQRLGEGAAPAAEPEPAPAPTPAPAAAPAPTAPSAPSPPPRLRRRRDRTTRSTWARPCCRCSPGPTGGRRRPECSSSRCSSGWYAGGADGPRFIKGCR